MLCFCWPPLVNPLHAVSRRVLRRRSVLIPCSRFRHPLMLDHSDAHQSRENISCIVLGWACACKTLLSPLHFLLSNRILRACHDKTRSLDEECDAIFLPRWHLKQRICWLAFPCPLNWLPSFGNMKTESLISSQTQSRCLGSGSRHVIIDNNTSTRNR